MAVTATSIVTRLLESVETIKSCAVRLPDGTVKTGSIHCAIWGDIMTSLNVEDEDMLLQEYPGLRKAVNGFLTSTGRFVDRREAYRIARAAAQADANPTRQLWHSDMGF